MPDRSLRLFFALPCPPPLAERIGRWRDDRPLPGRQVATANLHLTLAFLGQVPSARLEALLDMAAAIEAAPFDLYLDRLLRWRNGILLLAPSQPPGALLRLRRALRSGLAELELPVETRSFSAHLTLARDAAPLEDAPLPPTFVWQVDHFSLFCSQNDAAGVRYRTLRRWALCGVKRAFRAVTTRLFRSATQVMTGRQEAADFLAWRKKAEAGTVPAQGTAKRFSRKDSGDGWQDAPLGPINLR
ncbi:RNA 2',3'-cyclic phosphodiesterase [Pseudomonas aeruginosa]|uniref:RNA 2',3'-cyclic phosphodiesterase n=1 Tax=Pseudomonas aeruginosa TaxID=287 RepID=UPI0019691664|nr:RNA 2',3'-cyclic phosphodiesterase [Pseudomonas aeruginosa]